MSLTIDSSAWPEAVITSSMSFCASSSPVSFSASAMPSTPLSGVRISWLIIARKAVLAALARSAAAVARVSSAVRART